MSIEKAILKWVIFKQDQIENKYFTIKDRKKVTKDH